MFFWVYTIQFLICAFLFSVYSRLFWVYSRNFHMRLFFGYIQEDFGGKKLFLGIFNTILGILNAIFVIFNTILFVGRGRLRDYQQNFRGSHSVKITSVIIIYQTTHILKYENRLLLLYIIINEGPNSIPQRGPENSFRIAFLDFCPPHLFFLPPHLFFSSSASIFFFLYIYFFHPRASAHAFL